MRITLVRAHFGALCSLGQIGLLHDVGLRNRLRETGAPGLTIEFIERTEERFAARNVDVDPGADIIVVADSETRPRFRSGGSTDIVRSQTRTQFGIGRNWFWCNRILRCGGLCFSLAVSVRKTTPFRVTTAPANPYQKRQAGPLRVEGWILALSPVFLAVP